jgi:hypothetical protein
MNVEGCHFFKQFSALAEKHRILDGTLAVLREGYSCLRIEFNNLAGEFPCSIENLAERDCMSLRSGWAAG